MIALRFEKLNDGWNAEPNVPGEKVHVDGDTVELSFYMNPWAYEAAEGDIGRLSFRGCRKWRLGFTNDEGWYRGQCRYSSVAPSWGEFYEIIGLDPAADEPTDWHTTNSRATGCRHFLFYLRDTTFECFAADWAFSRG